MVAPAELPPLPPTEEQWEALLDEASARAPRLPERLFDGDFSRAIRLLLANEGFRDSLSAFYYAPTHASFGAGGNIEVMGQSNIGSDFRVLNQRPRSDYELVIFVGADKLPYDKLTAPEGYVLADNYRGAANYLYRAIGLKLQSAILPDSRHGSLRVGPAASAGLGVNLVHHVQGRPTNDLRADGQLINIPKNPDGLFLFKHNGVAIGRQNGA